MLLLVIDGKRRDLTREEVDMMRWTIETERKNDEFRLSLSLSHTHARAISLRLFKENCVQKCEIL